jgi:hypothetical protein
MTTTALLFAAFIVFFTIMLAGTIYVVGNISFKANWLTNLAKIGFAMPIAGLSYAMLVPFFFGS